MPIDALAFWLREPGVGENRPVQVPEPLPGDVLVRTQHSAISRGTESIVFRGSVPQDQYDVMRAPFQEGDFPAPVKYGYLNVGIVEEGPAHLVGRSTFCLYPHQTRYVVAATAVTLLPDGVPADRAVLAGTLETAINAAWDAAPLVGDRIAVIGAGMVGCCLARLLTAIPGAEVTLVDVDPTRRETATALGVAFAHPDEAPRDCDLVFHTSATSDGLQLSLDLLVDEGRVIDLSWYGDRQVSLSLGSSFHSRRLTIQASQVGRISPARRGTTTMSDRLALALRLLADPAYDCLITGRSPFAELPSVMPAIASGAIPAICHVIDYGGG